MTSARNSSPVGGGPGRRHAPMTFSRPRRASCALTVDEHTRLAAAAAGDGRTVSDYLRRLVIDHLGDRTADELGASS